MAFKRKTDTSGGDQFKFERVGQQITGHYLGSFDFEGDYGPTKKHLFKTAKGIKVVFGQRHLTELLEGETVGQLVQVTYVKDIASKKKGYKPMKSFTLDIDDENVLDESEIPENLDTAGETVDDDNTETEEVDAAADDEPSDVEEEEEPMDEVKTPPARRAAPPAAVKGPSAANRSKVEQLLKSRKAS